MSGRERARLVGFVCAAIALYAVHLLLLDYFFAGLWPLPAEPLNRGDFSTHATQTRRVIEGLQGAGQPWVYDVQLLAGAPNGVLFDADVKAWELWTWALVEADVGWGRAYNGFVLVIHAAMPAVVYASARLFGGERRAALTTTGLAIALWSFDSFTHWMWFIGTVTYVLVAYYALLPLALFHRWLERGPTRRRDAGGSSLALAIAASLALGHLLHPYLFFVLVAPMLALYVRATWVDKSMAAADHGIVAAIVIATVAANAWWLRTALRFFHYILDSAYYAQGGLDVLGHDLLGLLHDPSTQGMIGLRTSVRLLAVLAAIAGLRRWRRSGDRRRLPLVVLIASMALLTYFGGYTPFAQIQPYRHALPLGFALLVPAGAFLAATLAERPWRTATSEQRWLAAILAALASVALVRDVQYFFAPSVTQTQRLDDGREVLMNTLGHAFTPSYRYDQQNHWEQIIARVAALDEGRDRGRWLVHDQVLGEYLMARTDAQIIGGFVVRNLAHSDANWFRHHGDPPYPLESFRRFLATYGVRWLVVGKSHLDPFWDQHPRLWSRAGFADGMIIYRVRVPTALADDPGAEVRARTNLIEVRGSDPSAPLLLRYHWLETLACEPDCTIERAPVEDDRVGFIQIPAPHPADLRIVNAYTW